MKPSIAWVGLVLWPAAASAETPASPVALEQTVMLGVSLVRAHGELPKLLGAGGSFDRTEVWISVRGGTGGRRSATELGSQLGAEYSLRLGVTPKELDTAAERTPIGFSGGLQMTVRTLTFNLPFDGMLVGHFGGELGLGGAHWWSDTARFSFLGGLRLAGAGGDDARAELDYTLVPHVFGGAPGDLQVGHLEHRVTVTGAAGALGIGFQLRFWNQRTREGFTGSETRGHSLGLMLEWRS